tara:strand:+ start:1976 stop:2221 length:246 start_codon:yes stop_codon:yes gene_type:complete
MAIEHNVQTNEIKTVETGETATATPAIDILRSTRDRLLRETDYYALSDVNMSEDMKTYRQALRDLPANTSDPSKPTYPTKP